MRFVLFESCLICKLNEIRNTGNKVALREIRKNPKCVKEMVSIDELISIAIREHHRQVLIVET